MKIHWGRIAAGGFLAELAIFAVFIPVVMHFGDQPGTYTAVAASFVMPVLFGFWAARKVKSRFVLHGMLVGVVGILIYLALTQLQPEPWQYILAHGLKLLGGAIGGHFAAKQRDSLTNSEAASA